ncbi:MAG: YfhO family protein, partial [Erysipelotrichaceae bacterium]|nr:YfhO family protein [Erysipelotrichaceae bacterium]
EIKALLGNEEITGFEEAVPDGNNFYATITANEPGFAVMSVPWHKGWSVTVNGTAVKTYAVSGGLIGIPVTAGTNKIVGTFTPVGLKAGMYATIAGTAGFILLMIIDTVLKRRKR